MIPPSAKLTLSSPNSPYSASKAASDHLVRAYHPTYGLPVLTYNVYGWNEKPNLDVVQTIVNHPQRIFAPARWPLLPRTDHLSHRQAGA